MILNETCTLSNGVEIPRLGLGTWFISNKGVVNAVTEAVRIGYRQIDTAQAYRNEQGVGTGVRSCGIGRDELFITTKLAAGVKTYKKAAASIDSSLKKMGLDHIDMMLIHSPQPWTKYHGEDRFLDGNREAWRALEAAYTAGKLRAIGVSNFEKPDLDNILASCSVSPMVNQILAHISNTPTELIRYTQSKGIFVEAHSPIGHGELLKNTDVQKIADRYEVSIPQLSIRYDLQLGLLPRPKTTNPEHMKSNAEVDFVITEEDMELLMNIEQIKNYGNASMMPVYGGQLNLKSVLSMIIPGKRD